MDLLEEGGVASTSAPGSRCGPGLAQGTAALVVDGVQDRSVITGDDVGQLDQTPGSGGAERAGALPDQEKRALAKQLVEVLLPGGPHTHQEVERLLSA